VDISGVLPTFNRAAAVQKTLPSLLALRGVEEFVVVDDGSTDATPAVLAAAADGRLRVIRRARNGGTPAARNLAASRARGEWLLFAEDDCTFPPDFAVVLRREAEAHAADAVSAPMVHPGGRPLAQAVADARRRCSGDRGLDEMAGFPAKPVVTPFLPAPSLVRRSLVLRLGFDEGFRGNAYREETDFFLRALADGATCLLTPRTFFWEAGRWPGGQATGVLATEWWTVANNWRLLRRHGRWLADTGAIRSPLREQLAFVGRRALRMVRGAP
jgi:glycosyltransferase involved in cell wall biosynthesis